MLNNFTLLLLFTFFISQSDALSEAVQNVDSLSVANGKKYHRVPKVSGDIVVDANLTEPIWQDAVTIDANIEVQPGENILAPVKTEVLMAYNRTHIFVAFKAFDNDPSQIRAHFCDRDNIWDDDWVLILFDTFNDQRRTYDFGCNPIGIQCDFIETPIGGGGDWDSIWESDGKINELGYVVEMKIPFSSLNFPRKNGEQIWGFDAVRSYPRSVRHHIGVFPRDRNNNCYMCQSEKLVGFSGVTPGKNIEFDPTFSSTYSQERENGTSGNFIEKEKKYDPGLTAHWGFTPNLTLSGTINPDFSNIEADIIQLDINNQFALFYPEKRPFFLESADFFNTPLNMVHTRSLANPNWGAKITGKEGKNAIGLYSVQDEITNFLIPGTEGSDSESLEKESYGSVLRYKRDVGKSSNLGILATDREGENYHNRVGGIDGDIKFTSKDRFTFQMMRSSTAYPDSIIKNYNQSKSDFSGNAVQAKYSHDTKSFEIYSLYKIVDSDFRADLGFISQSGYKYSETGGIYRWRRAPGHWYNWISVYNSFDYRQDINGGLLHRAVSQRWNYEGPMQSHAHIYGEIGRDKYDGKEYRMNWLMGCAGFRPVPAAFVHLSWRYGDNIDYANSQAGTRLQLSPSIDLNLGLHLKIEGSHTFEKLDVNGGKLYTANVSRLKLIYQVNKRIFLRTILQYKDYQRTVELYDDQDTDPRTQKLFTQFLFSYKLNPETVFFLGYSDNYYGDREINMTQTNRALFVKFGYAFVL